MSDKILDLVFLSILRLGAGLIAGMFIALVTMLIGHFIVYYFFELCSSYLIAVTPFCVIATLYFWNKITIE